MVRLGMTSWKPLPSAVLSEKARADFNGSIAEKFRDGVCKLYDSILRRIEDVHKAIASTPY